jgi:hypothetical protein
MESGSEPETEQHPPMTTAERKREKDKNRPRHGKLQKKRMHVFNNPRKVAFEGWEDEPSPWSLITCEDYIEWCHLSKLFAPHRHLINRRMNKANLKYCSNEEFRTRALQAHQYLYDIELMPRNDCPLYLARMVYAEVILKKRVDWKTVRKTPKMPRVWMHMDMPREQHPRFPFAALGPQKADAAEDVPPEESDSSPDSDSDGKRGRRPSMTPAARASRKKRQRVKLQQATLAMVQAAGHEELPRVDVAGDEEPVAHVGGVGVEEAIPVMDDVPMMDVLITTSNLGHQASASGSTDMEANAHRQLLDNMRLKDATIERLQEEFRNFKLESSQKKDETIKRLEEEILALKLESTQKSDIIAKQAAEIVELRHRDRHTFTAEDFEGVPNVPSHSHAVASQANVGDEAQSVDDTNLDNLVDNITSCLLESTPRPRRDRIARRPYVFLPSVNVTVQPFVDPIGIEDSLSFPSPNPSMEMVQLRTANEILQKRIASLSEQYYQWKVACILNVDRARQMAMEFKKIDSEYTSLNTRRDFGLTSWAHIDEMFPSELPMRDGRSIDWARLGWNHAEAMSSHALRPSGDVAARKLWPTPATFTQNGDDCSVCLNPFGPEGAYALGTCRCLYHPMCLLGGLLTRRFCAKCRAPFHERLYDLFGLTIYMPPSWELNPETAPSAAHANRWGEDLVWSWRASAHQLDKSNVSSQIGWENDHEEIVRVCKKLISGSTAADVGRRNFFYQVMGGYWDVARKRFQFGRHPDGLLWDNMGRVVSTLGEGADLNLRNALQWEESQWKEAWKEEAIDFLLEAHSPETMRTLKALRNSKMLRALINSDGPHRRTRASRRLLGDGAGTSASGELDASNTSGAGASGAGASGAGASGVRGNGAGEAEGSAAGERRRARGT